MISLQPTAAPLGAIASGLDLRKQIDEPTRAAIQRGLQMHLVLVLRGHQPCSDAELLRFAGSLGEVADAEDGDNVRPGYRAISVVSNISHDGRHAGASDADALDWHTDCSCQARLRRLQILDAMEVPDDGGATYWADMYSAYDRLAPAQRERISRLRAVHEAHGDHYYRAVHPLVMTDPDSGRRALFVNSIFTSRILGLTPAESDALLSELCAHATAPDIVYRHDWKCGDIVLWDAVGTLHRRDAFDPSSRRYLRQISMLVAQDESDEVLTAELLGRGCSASRRTASVIR